jgi:hypothetical protein
MPDLAAQLAFETESFTTSFDAAEGLTITVSPYHGGWLAVRWLGWPLGCALIASLFVDLAFPQLQLCTMLNWVGLHPRSHRAGPLTLWIAAPILAACAARVLYELFIDLYAFCGRETIRIDTNTLSITRSFFGLSRRRAFEMDRIGRITPRGWTEPYRQGPEEDDETTIGFPVFRRYPRGPLIIPLDPGGLHFRYDDDKRIRFATGLRKRESLQLLSIIAKVWPGLAGGT